MRKAMNEQEQETRVDGHRAAFRAGFLAVCRKAGNIEPIAILTRVWTFDGVAAADLEAEAWAAWREVSPAAPPSPPLTALREVIAEYGDDYRSCEDCGPLSLCRLHSLVSRLDAILTSEAQ